MKTTDLLELAYKGFKATDVRIRNAADTVFSFTVHKLRAEHIDVPPAVQPFVRRLINA